ncbi:hypothetical protein BD293_3926 [Roseinatronobacter monicus]|uniref:Uncharacterized protein n=1 Tax=Roseinatronobacter monicus TaxID=393481 RepID=A0A543K631_9RHOB|nr:hypothetical protein BD293_3926 [Roseinatronobacter monicus]
MLRNARVTGSGKAAPRRSSHPDRQQRAGHDRAVVGGGELPDGTVAMLPQHQTSATVRDVTRKWADGVRPGRCIAGRWIKLSAEILMPSLYQHIADAYADTSRSRSRNFRNTSRSGSKRST